MEGESSSVVFYEEGVERFRIVGFEEEIYELIGVGDEVFFCARLGGKQGLYV